MAKDLEVVAQGNLSHQADRGAYMPVITELRNGELIACQHVGQQLASSDNYIEVLCNDGGTNWALQASIGEGAEGWTYRGPDISELPDGQLLLTATRFETGNEKLFDPDSEGLQRPELILSWSDDCGSSWSPVQVVSVDLPPDKYTWNKAGSLVQFSPTRWMFPFETWKPDGYTPQPDQKAAAVFSNDQGQSWGELTIIADDTSGERLWWDQLNARLPDGRLYVMLWTHLYGTKDDLNNHWVVSSDDGRTWSEPQPTNLRGQVCCPIPLSDGRIAAIYNHRQEPQGIHVAVAEDFSTFDLEHEIVVFDAGAEATLGETDHENFLAEHMLIAFGKPFGTQLLNGDILTSFWCTVDGITHTRWVRLRVPS